MFDDGDADRSQEVERLNEFQQNITASIIANHRINLLLTEDSSSHGNHSSAHF